MTIHNKNIIFTVTHGRTGTTMLTEVFKIFHDIRSEHEPEPNYASILPKVKENPRYAINFLKKKIDIIKSLKESNYIETSNVFGKGFFIPLLRMGIKPKIILLNRDFRKTAESLFKRGSTPMRTKMGQHFSADPSFPGTLPIFQPESLTDYQLCYWGVLDSYFRQIKAAALYEDLGETYVWASATDFNDFSKTLDVGKKLSLEVKDLKEAERRHKEIASTHHNPNKKISMSFDDEETEVLDRIAFYEPLFIEKVRKSCFFDKKLANKL